MPPTGFKRSRALWDHARRPYSNWKDGCLSWMQAFLYELQPIRMSLSDFRAWKKRISNLIVNAGDFVTKTTPTGCKILVSFLTRLNRQQWALLAAIVLYYVFVRVVHDVLEAGPIVLILTALGAIFTVGLSDEETNGLSAYSVFNRGFQRIMGSVDPEELLAQHVGGGGMIGMPMAQRPPPHQNRQRDRHHPPRVEPAEPDVAVPPDHVDEPALDDNVHNNRRARKSGKKARRGNLEQRREMRHQREAALAMGFGGDVEGVAINRLVEDQVVHEE